YVYSGERCRLVLLGDVAQLPPVGYTTSPALACSTLRSYSLTVYELSLTDTARQRKDSGILANATLLRRILASGNLTAPTLEVSAYPDVEVVGGDTLAESVEHCYATDGTDATIIITRSNRRAVMFNQGIRARVLYMEAEITTGDMLLVAKNNYFWAEGYDQIDFIANGDVAVVRRISEVTTLYGFRFADVTLEFPDYQVELDAKILLDALYAEAPALTRDENERLYQNVMADYADVSRKSERYRLMKQNPFFNALQVKFAYSVTCHKAQGGQWKNVFIDMGYIPEDAYSNVDFYRWLYTSFTRATRHIYLINPPLAVK
ncbi:MAG: ATP-binding domain-containing protein, partial [Muribaculaceae bacterium]|nr:ATP-binding domain-containing protein [Muribaculaceae bacterium]